jgi:hypothetical protein
VAAKKCLDSGFKGSGAGERLELKECKSINAEVTGEQVIILFGNNFFCTLSQFKFTVNFSNFTGISLLLLGGHSANGA